MRAVCSENNAREVRSATVGPQRDALWKARKRAFGAVGRLAPSNVTQDGVIPRTKLPEMLKQIGYTLACTAITRDKNFIDALMESTLIDRLNIGPISTMKISWDQPHEGNMFEFLYKRRSIEIGI